MPFPSSIHMPGAFNSEGVHPGLFRPPVSPSPNADYLGAPVFTQRHSSRRRWSRGDVLPFQDGYCGDAYMDGDALFGRPARPQHRPYALAGQLGNPVTADDHSMFMGESMFSDSDYRTALGSKRSRDQMEGATPPPAQLYQLSPKPQPSAGWGSIAMSTIGGVVGRFWEFCKIGSFKGFSAGGGVSFQMTPEGGLAEVKPALPTPPAEDVFSFQGHQWHDENPYYDDGRRQTSSFRTGRLFQDIPETPEFDVRYSSPGRAAKRRQTDFVPELGRNWVMIREPSETFERRTPGKLSTPQRHPSQMCGQQAPSFAGGRFSTPISRPSNPVLPLPTTTPRRPTAHTPGHRLSSTGSSRLPRPASAASFASFAGQPAPTPSKIPVRANPLATPPRSASASILPASTVPLSMATTAAGLSSLEAPHHANSRRRRHTALPPTVGHGHSSSSSTSSPHASNSRRRTNSAASLASSRLDRGGARGGESSRLDEEARQLATQWEREEREADVRMSAFNRQLQDMIRQGQEALGTTVEVDMTDEAEDMWWDDL